MSEDFSERGFCPTICVRATESFAASSAALICLADNLAGFAAPDLFWPPAAAFPDCALDGALPEASAAGVVAALLIAPETAEALGADAFRPEAFARADFSPTAFSDSVAEEAPARLAEPGFVAAFEPAVAAPSVLAPDLPPDFAPDLAPDFASDFLSDLSAGLADVAGFAVAGLADAGFDDEVFTDAVFDVAGEGSAAARVALAAEPDVRDFAAAAAFAAGRDAFATFAFFFSVAPSACFAGIFCSFLNRGLAFRCALALVGRCVSREDLFICSWGQRPAASIVSGPAQSPGILFGRVSRPPLTSLAARRQKLRPASSASR